MRIRLALSAALGSLALFAASAAFAQESMPDDAAAEPADPTGATGDDDAGPTGDDSAGATAGAAVSTAPPAAGAPYPQRALDRPRTLPGGAFQATAELAASEGSAYAGRLQGLYSPVDKLQAAITYDYGIDPAQLDGQLALAARYYIFKAPPHLFTSVQVTLPLDFTPDEVTDERTVFRRINLAAPIKYKFNDMFGAFFGDNLLDVEVEPEFGLALNFPVSVGVQANDNVFAVVATNLAKIDLDDTSAVHLGDRIPLAITGLYAFNYTLDAVASVNFTNLLDSMDTPNTVSVIVGVNYRGGFAN